MGELMKTLFSAKRNRVKALDAMAKGTPVRIGAVALFRSVRGSNLQLTGHHQMRVGYQSTAIPVLWATNNKPLRVGELWFLADKGTHLWGSGVIRATSQSDVLLAAMRAKDPFWVRPHLEYRQCDVRDNRVSWWKLVSVTLSQNSADGLWDYWTDTPVNILPERQMMVDV